MVFCFLVGFELTMPVTGLLEPTSDFWGIAIAAALCLACGFGLIAVNNWPKSFTVVHCLLLPLLIHMELEWSIITAATLAMSAIGLVVCACGGPKPGIASSLARHVERSAEKLANLFGHALELFLIVISPSLLFLTLL